MQNLGADFSRTFKLGLTKATLTGTDFLNINYRGQQVFSVKTTSDRALPLADFLTFFNFATGNSTLNWFTGAQPVKNSTFTATLGLISFAAVLQVRAHEALARSLASSPLDGSTAAVWRALTPQRTTTTTTTTTTAHTHPPTHTYPPPHTHCRASSTSSC